MIDLDLDIVRRAQAGDEAASRTLIEELHRPVISTCYRFLGPRMRSEVEDVAQEVFVKVFRALHRFDPDRGVKFTTWVYSFIRNHCFDTLKKRRLPTTSLSGGDDEPWTLPDDSVRPPPSTAENRELGEQIELALASLGRDQRTAFVLREYEGLGYADIAQVMGISEGTVKSRLHRAKQALRDRLGPYLEAAN